MKALKINLLGILFILLSKLIVNKSAYLNLEGFGTDMEIIIDQQITVSSELQLSNSIRSNTLITFCKGFNQIFIRGILLKNVKNIVLVGPATIYNQGVYIENSNNVIIKNIRVINASIYGIFVYHSTNVVIDHCTILDAGRSDIVKGKCIDITQQASNITVSYSLLGFTSPKELLIKHKGLLAANFLQGPVQNVSLHHNLYYCVYQRSPEISSSGLFDMRENVVFNYTEYGSRIRNGAFGNFVSNWFIGGKKDPLVYQDSEKQVYSILNTWKYDCKVQEQIPDQITHAQYSAPRITTRTLSQTVKDAGCFPMGLWQYKIYGQVSQFI